MTVDPGIDWLDEEEQRAWRAFIAMQTQLGAHLRRSLARDAGLSDADYEVLVHLSEAPDDRLRVFELARELQWEKSRLSHQLRRMEGRGLLERSECETDGRGAYVTLAPAGRSAITDAAPLHVAEVRRHFVDVLTRDQLAALTAIADAVLTGLQVNTDACGVPGSEADCEEETTP